MYSRSVQGQDLTFRFNPELYFGNLILDDHQTGSTWSQLGGRAVRGPLQGTPLEVVPSIQTTWQHWRTLHPETLVVDPNQSLGLIAPYLRQQPGRSQPDPQRLAEMGIEMVLGVETGTDVRAYPFLELARAGQTVRQTLGARPLVVHYVADVPAAWATDEGGQVLQGTTTTLNSWLTFHPHSQVYVAEFAEGRPY